MFTFPQMPENSVSIEFSSLCIILNHSFNYFLWPMHVEMSQFTQGLISHQIKMGPVPMLRTVEF